MNTTNQENIRISVAQMAPHIHHFVSGENKVDKISAWLIAWIKKSLENKTIEPYYLLPLKSDLASHIGVSLGTMQNAFRKVEDAGYIESKQKIGSFVVNPACNKKIEKLTSKKELVTEIVKKFILDNGFKEGQEMISARKLAEHLGVSNSTVRLSFLALVDSGILSKNKTSFYVKTLNFGINSITTKTLAEKIAEKIKKYVEFELQVIDKLPTNIEFSQMYNVSLKTVHDAVKILSREGVLYTRRGRYGTQIYQKDKQNELYEYEKFEQKIRHYISENCQVGDKLPSINELTQSYKTSAKTIKHALDNLAEEGYLTFIRGRYGGTFVTDIPQSSSEAYKWLAISEDYMTN
ncbi:MAG: GntR family transcriptional regulator [Cyanobacteria bacterium SIG28]|nr:GntR family transcriptional regulator [Cyanobacteria bacterium SIG28]